MKKNNIVINTVKNETPFNVAESLENQFESVSIEGAIPVRFPGIPVPAYSMGNGMYGGMIACCTSDEDREECAKFLNDIAKKFPNASPEELQRKLFEVATISAAAGDNGVDLNKLKDLTVDGEKYFVSFSKKKVYDKNFTAVADFAEFGDMPEKAALKVCEMLIKQA